MAEKQPSFEQAVAELEQLVRDMESGQLPLETMIAQFEAGMKLVKLCRSKLEIMNRKIELLVKDDGAAGQWQNFDPDSERARASLKPVAPPAASEPAAPENGDLPF